MQHIVWCRRAESGPESAGREGGRASGREGVDTQTRENGWLRHLYVAARRDDIEVVEIEGARRERAILDVDGDAAVCGNATLCALPVEDCVVVVWVRPDLKRDRHQGLIRENHLGVWCGVHTCVAWVMRLVRSSTVRCRDVFFLVCSHANSSMCDGGGEG